MKIKPGLEADYAAYVEMNSKDPYSKAVVDFTERWAKLMEKKLEHPDTAGAGTDIGDIEGATSREADTEGITGFMYGCAIEALARYWVFGEDLRKWHNQKHGVGPDKEGVVNPAIINISIG